MTVARPGVAVIGTLDTKSEEFGYLCARLVSGGVRPVLVDTSILGESRIPSDFASEEVARRGGSTLTELRTAANRATAIAVMSRGAAEIVRELHARGAINGAIGIGGGQGSTIAAAALCVLPVGVPKVIVSTIASVEGASTQLIGTRDTTLINSVVDISGVNSLFRTLIANAAAAIAGMVLRERDPAETLRGFRVAQTMFGVTSPCVNEVRRLLELTGLEVIVFAATGSGDRAMEEMILDGQIDGVVDITISQLGQGIIRGDAPAGARRLSIAGERGIPQVVSFGGLDIIVCPAENRFVIEAKQGLRLSHRHSSTMTVVRPTPQESAVVGAEIARRLNAATGPTVVAIPLRGFSEYSIEGGPLHDPAADAALLDAFRKNINPRVPVREIDLAINEPAFAGELAAQFLRLTSKNTAVRVSPMEFS